MEKNREELVKWTLEKAEEYLESANENFKKNRLFPAAEEIFRVIETTLEALLYNYDVKGITYPGKKKEFTGRLALQFLVRDNLVNKQRIEKEIYEKYIEMASNLHLAGYQPMMRFDRKKLNENLKLAEDFLIKGKSISNPTFSKIKKKNEKTKKGKN